LYGERKRKKTFIIRCRESSLLNVFSGGIEAISNFGGSSSATKGAAMDLAVIQKDMKPFFLGALAGALLISWVGFQLVGWKSPGVAARLAKTQTDTAMVTELSRICSVQFNKSANVPERLAELKKTERWSRGGVITKAGFATMPGDKEPVNGVAEACAELLVPEKN
jgi:hypothetical protein